MSSSTDANGPAWLTLAYVSFGIAMNISVLLVIFLILAVRRRNRRQLRAVVHRGGIVFPNGTMARQFYA
ncbi:hypothetical protein CDD82_637 [Ophiocordyceps australis]|uniref:Uncharacterized protein n=1 Tax=Ophiocordyceps australis TaxID=1399860 RepID=A0A2C5XDE4_9HYPO|nr:hypothetical protein CDD82_637 [Ophiocordyceps australis]